METVGLTGDHNEESGCSWLSCCNLSTRDGGDTTTLEGRLTLAETSKPVTEVDEEPDVIQMRVGALQRKMEHTERKIKRLTKQKTLAEETISTLTEDAKNSEKRAEVEAAAKALICPTWQ